MTGVSGATVEVLYVVAAVSVAVGLKELASPRTARRGILFGAVGAAVALVAVLLDRGRAASHLPWILLATAVGAAIAVPAARRVPLARAPQFVALLDGLGAAAVTVVALLHLANGGDPALGTDRSGRVGVALAVLVGAVSFAGAVVTVLGQRELVPPRPVVLPAALPLLLAGLVVGLGLAGGVFVGGNLAIGLLLCLAALILGVMIVLPVGGGSPVVVPLLNACTGVAVAAVGLALHNTVLLLVGTLGCASGVVLTRAAAAAAHRSVLDLLIGPLRPRPASAIPVDQLEPVAVVDPADGDGDGDSDGDADADGDAHDPAVVGAVEAAGPPEETASARSVGPEDVASLLGAARKVVVVPGYGFAVAQAQQVLGELVRVLEQDGAEVLFGVHPVAGRMPGHLNVLLAEADVPYRALREPEDANREFPSADVALVIGANDVVNPAARTAPGPSVHGMPVLEVSAARQVVFLKRSTGPGFAGIENALLSDPSTSLLLGDIDDSLTAVLGAVRTA